MRLTYLFIGFWYNISYGCILNVFNNYNIKDIKSHLSIIHSGLITVSSILYLNNIIEIQYVLDNLYFLSSYMSRVILTKLRIYKFIKKTG